MPAFTRSELADLNVFMTIVRRRSFRHSAQELGVSTSALSHSMRNLEARLGVKLLNRTSRSVVPTDAGSALAAKLEDGFQVIGEALGELDAYRTSPVGRLRLNVPRDASRLQLVLPDWTSMGAPFCLYYPSRRQPQPGLRQLMEMIRGDWLGRA
ncbi:LysR family transcriptional regulator [Pseudomonas aeruginosa]|uniref:LysR family transcriptional regulator n=1 Tax=Pseudomonas aeruginosa TaxID=287 RepID=UPI0029C02198|nr:LysR family transcriptional regulator [Pseudomonas aeruginosa]